MYREETSASLHISDPRGGCGGGAVSMHTAQESSISIFEIGARVFIFMERGQDLKRGGQGGKVKMA